MTSDYRDNYYDHFSKRISINPPQFKKDRNYMMRFHAQLSKYSFENNNLSIIYFKEGSGELRWKDRRLKIGPNKFIVTNPGLGWEYHNEKQEYIDVLSFVVNDALRQEFDYYCTATQTQLLDDPFREGEQTSFFLEHPFGADHYRSGKLLQHIHALSHKADYHCICPEELSIEVLQTIYQDQYTGHMFADRINAKKPSTKIEAFKRLLSAYEYIQGNLGSPISLEELSRVSSLSKYHLYNSFKNVFGKTPHRYINSLKVIKAREELQKGQRSVSEVSDMFGFGDLAVFSKIFKKVHGKPPSYYQ